MLRHALAFCLCLAAVPALAQSVTPPAALQEAQKQLNAAADDPFASLNIQPGDTLPPIKCMSAKGFAAAVSAHDGSPVIRMSINQAMFFRGFYAALPMTSPGYPVGDDVVYAVRAMKDKAAIEGTVGFTLGEGMVCNVIPVTEQLLNMLFKIDSGRAPI